jgi:hypothetical protein
MEMLPATRLHKKELICFQYNTGQLPIRWAHRRLLKLAYGQVKTGRWIYSIITPPPPRLENIEEY